MTDEQRLRQALTWTGGGAIAIGLVQLMLATSGPMSARLWIIVGASFVGQMVTLTAASIVLRALLKAKDAEETGGRIRRIIQPGVFALLAALVVSLIVGTLQMNLIEGVVAGGIVTVLGLQGIAAIWIADRILAGKQI